MFGAQLPSFNLDQKSTVNTACGSIATIVTLLVTFIFGLLKFEHMINRKNPMVNTNLAEVDDETAFDIRDDDFMIAFAAEAYMKDNFISDPRLVRWYARFRGVKNGE